MCSNVASAFATMSVYLPNVVEPRDSAYDPNLFIQLFRNYPLAVVVITFMMYSPHPDQDAINFINAYISMTAGDKPYLTVAQLSYIHNGLITCIKSGRISNTWVTKSTATVDAFKRLVNDYMAAYAVRRIDASHEFVNRTIGFLNDAGIPFTLEDIADKNVTTTVVTDTASDDTSTLNGTDIIDDITTSSIMSTMTTMLEDMNLGVSANDSPLTQAATHGFINGSETLDDDLDI